jgi:ABC-type Na+ efflux pump permease subunit
LRSALVVARRELSSLRSEKTIALAIVTQLFVAAFSSFLVVGLVALYDPGASGGGVTVTVGVTGDASDDLAPVVADDTAREVDRFQNRAAAMSAFRAGEVDAVLDTTRQPAGNVTVEATVPEGDLRTTFVVVQVKEALSAFERDRRAALADRREIQPVALPPATGGNPYFGFAYAVLVPVLVFLPVFIGGSIASDSLTEEVERGTIELLRVSPLSVGELVDGKALTAVALAPVQAGAWLALLAVNGIRVANPLPILLVTTTMTAVAVAGGLGIAAATGERRSAQLLYSLAVFLGFGLTTALPENPANVVAKFAIGSPTAATWGTLLASVPVAVVAYAVARRAAALTLGPE